MAPPPPRIELLVLQGTGFCNIDCRYCYLPGRDDRRRMPPATLATVLAKVLRSRFVGGEIVLCWHAGEPLVLPRRFYADAIATASALAPPGLRVRHNIQTNATLLDDAWPGFIAEHDIRLGLSLDGPAFLHDAARLTRQGRGTHAAVMAAVARLRQHNVPFHVITVLRRESLRHPDSLFDFYRAHGIREVAFNIEEIDGIAATSSLAASGVEAEFRAFLRRFLARMRAEPGAVALREQAWAAAAIAQGVPEGYNQEADPFRILSVAHDGRVASFSPELLGTAAPAHGDFILGDLLAEDIETIWQRTIRAPLAAEIARGIAACRASCAHFGLCGGGAPANKWAEHGRLDATETMYCRLMRKALVEEVLADMEVSLGLAA